MRGGRMARGMAPRSAGSNPAGGHDPTHALGENSRLGAGRFLKLGRLFPVQAGTSLSRLTHRFQGGRDRRVEMSRAAAIVAGVPRIQALFRRFLVTREYHGIKADRDIIFDRRDLLAELVRYSRQRNAYFYGVCYAVFFALVIALAAVALKPEVQFEGGGFNAAQVLTMEVGDDDHSFAAHDFHMETDFYEFLRVAILGKMALRTVNGVSVMHFGNIGSAEMIEPIVIAQHRSRLVACSSQYAVPPSQDTYNGNQCALPLSSGLDYSDYGDTSNDLFLETIEPAFKEEYWASTATLCPNFRYVTAETATLHGAHAIELPRTLPVANLTAIVDGLERCNFIDQQTRYVVIEMDLMAGNERPLYTTFELMLTYSPNGQTTTQWEVVTVDASDPDSSVTSQTALAILITLTVLCALGLSAILVDTVHYAMRTSVMWAVKNTMDFWVVLTITQYALVIVNLSLFVDMRQKGRDMRADSLTGSTSFLPFKNTIFALSAAQRSYSVAIGLLTFVSFLRIMQFTRHRGMLSLLQRAMMKVVMPILHFLLGTLPVMGAFISVSYLVFGAGIYEYSTIALAVRSSVVSLYTSDAVGFVQMSDFDAVTTWIYYLTFKILVVTVMMSFIISIILEGYRIMTTEGKDTSRTLYQEAWHQYINFIEMHSPFLFTSEQMAWMLLHEGAGSIGTSSRHVTLRDIKMLLPGRPSKEAVEAMIATAKLRDGSPVNARTVIRIMGAPYLYFKKKARYPWIFRYVPGMCVVQSHAVYFRLRGLWFVVVRCGRACSRSKSRREEILRRKRVARKSAPVRPEPQNFDWEAAEHGGSAMPFANGRPDAAALIKVPPLPAGEMDYTVDMTGDGRAPGGSSLSGPPSYLSENGIPTEDGPATMTPSPFTMAGLPTSADGPGYPGLATDHHRAPGPSGMAVPGGPQVLRSPKSIAIGSEPEGLPDGHRLDTCELSDV